jgi:hypothetical protein
VRWWTRSDQGRSDAGIAEQRAGIEGKDTMPRSQLTSCRAKRGDTLIASAVLAALIAGWVLNFVTVKQVTLRLDSLVAATARWA